MPKFLSVIFGLILAVIPFTGSDVLQKNDDIKFYSPQQGIFIVEIDTSKNKRKFDFYISEELETVEDIAEKNNAVVAINAGFFDPKNKKTVSFVIKSGEIIADPRLNESLTDNIKLEKYLPKILNRAEFRILEHNGAKKYFITHHNNKLPQNYDLLSSLQAGPMLLPEFTPEKEAFIVKQDGKIIKSSAGIRGKYPRSAIAIKNDHVLLIAVDKTSPLTLKELSLLLKKMHVDSALALDGGSSTSLYVNINKKFNLISTPDNIAREVKSVILVK